MAGQLQVDGIIYLGTIVSDELLVTAKSLHHIRAVHVFRNTDAADVEIVNIDGYAAGEMLGKLVLEQGYQRYGYITGYRDDRTMLRPRPGLPCNGRVPA